MKEIHWISLKTWHTGHGKPLPDRVAEELAEEANEKWRELYHWTVAVRD